MSQPDLWSLYRQMLTSRLFEEAVKQLWEAGQISGEMHLGTGEEAIMAGVVSQMEEGDALALDHRGTAALLVRGVDPVLLLREFLGHRDGLCGGMGGHMHLFSRQHLAASSGIVGASGPAAAGFALAAQHLRPGKLAVAFFGEGAMNQGMLLEALNLAVVWRLPVVFVCKNNRWAITTPSPDMTGGNLLDRARSFGMEAIGVDGSDVEAVWRAAHVTMAGVRNGGGPVFLHATCAHLEGHYLGDPLVRIARRPVRGMGPLAGPLVKAFTNPRGAALRERTGSLMGIMTLSGKSAREQLSRRRDPLVQARRKLGADGARLQEVEEAVEREIWQVVEAALGPG